uniref:Uncharacterized protein n=1 Tax=Physcomitrium patens TaxID=3218 RepID=A0A2K1KWQ2_PHYPA|nr:hypothetical protein PHYPA_005222 [Physcomitrium patens]
MQQKSGASKRATTLESCVRRSPMHKWRATIVDETLIFIHPPWIDSIHSSFLNGPSLSCLGYGLLSSPFLFGLSKYSIKRNLKCT